MKDYLGFIPSAVIGVQVRDQLGYGGCFDHGPLFVKLPAIAAGTIRNLAFLLFDVAPTTPASLIILCAASEWKRDAALRLLAVAVALVLVEGALLANGILFS